MSGANFQRRGVAEKLASRNRRVLPWVVSTLQEIKSAIANLPDRERALLAAELCAADLQPDADELEVALTRGLNDVRAGRVRELDDVRSKLGEWTSKS